MEHKISNELPPIPGEAMHPGMMPAPEAPRIERVSEQQAAQAIETGAVGQMNPLANPTGQQAQFLGQVAQTGGTPQQQAVQSGLPPIADDTDLIEKEWVLKAKEIVARTKNDPYQQNKEVERMKADYMKKRYNKDIKVTED